MNQRQVAGIGTLTRLATIDGRLQNVVEVLTDLVCREKEHGGVGQDECTGTAVLYHTKEALRDVLLAQGYNRRKMEAAVDTLKGADVAPDRDMSQDHDT